MPSNVSVSVKLGGVINGSSGTAPLPKLDFGSQAPLRILVHPLKGRCFIANRNIRAGELVHRARPYAAIPDFGKVHAVCYHCSLKFSDSTISASTSGLKAQGRGQREECSGCGYAVYCGGSGEEGKGCREADKNIHQYECDFLKGIRDGSNEISGYPGYTQGYCRLILRILIRHYLEDISGKAEADDGLTFRQHVWNMCSNFDGFTADKMKEFESVAQILHTYLLKISKFSSSTANSNNSDTILSRQQILDLICKEECNSFGLYSFDRPQEPRQSYGLALYPSAVYFNHSCFPNVVHTTLGRDELFFAARDIQADEELTITYIPLRQTTEERLQELQSVFLFHCDCPRCQDDSNEGFYVDSLKEYYVCSNVECHGVYLPHTLDNQLAVPSTPTNSQASSGGLLLWKCEVCGRKRGDYPQNEQ